MLKVFDSMRRPRLAALALALAGCGGGGGGAGAGGGSDGSGASTAATAADTTVPTVTGTTPAPNATAVARTGTVSATFSEAVDCATVNADTFTVAGVTGSVTCEGSSATFTAASALNTNTTYTATLNSSVRDVAGNALAAPQRWTFTTAAARAVFSAGFQAGDVFSASETGGLIATLADTLDAEEVARWRTTYDASSTAAGTFGDGSAYVASDVQSMVRDGRVVYQRFREDRDLGLGVQVDLYAVNLDGTQRVPLAATANDERAFALVGDRLVYTSRSTTTTNLRSVRLDGTGDIAITNATDLQNQAFPVGFTGTRVVFTEGESGGTYISEVDGSNRVKLWNRSAFTVIVAGNRLVLPGIGDSGSAADGKIVAVNTDGTGFVALTTELFLGIDPGQGIFPGSPLYGVAASRVFYRSVDQSTSPPTFRLRSVGLDGAEPLVLAPPTTAFLLVKASAGSQLIVEEGSGANLNLVSYDIARAGSRALLLAGHNFMLQAEGRLVGFKPSGTNGFSELTISSVNPDGTAAATLAQGAIPVGSVNVVRLANNQIVYKKAAPSGRIEGYAVNLDGSGTTALTNAIAGDKDLLDIVAGRLIFESFPTGQPTATRNLHSVLLTGAGGLDYATTAADERYLGAFGDKLLFTSRLSDGGAQDLKLVPTAGGAAVLLQNSPERKFFVGAY